MVCLKSFRFSSAASSFLSAISSCIRAASSLLRNPSMRSLKACCSLRFRSRSSSYNVFHFRASRSEESLRNAISRQSSRLAGSEAPAGSASSSRASARGFSDGSSVFLSPGSSMAIAPWTAGVGVGTGCVSRGADDSLNASFNVRTSFVTRLATRASSVIEPSAVSSCSASR